jgi:hypothetical protein
MSTEMVPMATSSLPVSYEAAQRALAECSRVDECKGWSDRAAALAAYARMAKNDDLRLMALRIQARAVRRCGELLKQVPAASGARTDQPGVGAHTRSQVAEEAGLSRNQRVTALRVATVPQADFTAAVESNTPPSVTQLAVLGTLKSPTSSFDVSKADAVVAARAHALLRDFAAFCGLHDPIGIAKVTGDSEAFSTYVRTIDSWLDRFVTNLDP